ncbi:hypothetical protein [Saccharicrinis fermentans]|uniref:hypothetical protein n=1 Tax=Saccharicrinis fermentans TaxID=982 RepID=UPI00138AF9E0|nr:hypothetical protein [Saccharicrinis fermentans]
MDTSAYVYHIDIKDYDIEKIKETIEDTLIYDKETLSTVYVDKNILGFMHKNYKSNIATFTDFFLDSGNLQLKYQTFKSLTVGFFFINYTANNPTYSIYNYIELTTIDKVDSIAAKYPICWQEAIKLVRAKIGPFKLEAIGRSNSPVFEDEPEHYWFIEAKRFDINKHRCYLVNAETGEIQSKLIYGIKIP